VSSSAERDIDALIINHASKSARRKLKEEQHGAEGKGKKDENSKKESSDERPSGEKIYKGEGRDHRRIEEITFNCRF